MKQVKTLLLFVLLSLPLQILLGQGLKTPPQKGMLSVEIQIVDSERQPLSGATVQVKGKKQGVMADLNGNVLLWVDKGRQIIISFVGMKPKRITINKALRGQIVLKEEAALLDQVVVTGYSTTSKRRSTGSLAVIKTKDLKTSPTANLDGLLQGKLTGVDVKALSGRPGETVKIRIRGTNTISGNADPLWVVDGVALQRDIPKISQAQVLSKDFSDIFTNGISGINPNDIESITVLKDASAAAIYGSRAAGGVIVVTTKRGQAGDISVNYSTNVSMVTRPPRSISLMNAQEKLAWEQELWDEFSAKGFAAGKDYPVIGAVGMIRSGYGDYNGWTKEQQDAEIARLGQHTTNWFDEIFRSSLSQSHYVSLSGGSKRNTFYVSLGYSNNKGLLKNDDYKRYNVSAKLDMKHSDKLKTRLSLDMSMQDSHSASLYVDPFSYAYFANPYERPYNEDGTYAADKTYRSLKKINGGYDNTIPPNGFNVLRELELTKSKTKNLTATAIANLTYKIIDALDFEGLASYGYVANNGENFLDKNSYAAWMDRPFLDDATKRVYSSISENSAYNLNYTLRGQLHFNKTFAKKHYLNILLGSEIRGHYAKSIYSKRYGYDPVSGNSAMPVYPEDTKVDYSKLQSYAKLMDLLNGHSIRETAFASFYFSTDYVYDGRYVASLTARMDGSNNFGSKEQFNPTGSVGLSWNIDKESFMEPLEDVISSLSLRTAMGYTGNINRGVYPQLVMDYHYAFRKTDKDYYRMGWIKNAPNPHLRWEKTQDFKLGLAMGFLDERIHFSAEFYNRHTYDAVSDILIAQSTGFRNQKFNTSELRNRGVELQLNARLIQTDDWRVSASVNLAYNENQLLRYDPPTTGVFNGFYEGYPLGSIFSGKLRSIDPQLGIYSYEPRPDAVLETPADRNKAENYLYYLGTSSAPYNGGYSLNLSYKNLSLYLGGSFSMGAKVVDNLSYPARYTNVDKKKIEYVPTVENDLYVHHLNVNKDATERWTEANPRTDAHPRLINAHGEYLGLSNYVPNSSNITKASRLQDLSYFKLGSVSLSYSLDSEWTKRVLHLNSVSFSLMANNLFIISSYKGLDPESPGATYPIPQTYSCGLSIGF